MIMIQLNKDEVEIIREKYPSVKIHKTVGKYYVTEYRFIMDFLKKYRNANYDAD